ncbi:hypothetical protein ACFV6F_15055, partial [Kitasatospora phosalacinea]|uniref:hypothetical protein n=1 Tax=Kitasatospora phosalacinea TaxID=2065 RepID=UPI0036580979
MTDSSLKALLDYAKSQVAQARNQPRTGSPQAGIALAYGLELLGRVIEGVQSDLEGGELVEGGGRGRRQPHPKPPRQALGAPEAGPGAGGGWWGEDARARG